MRPKIAEQTLAAIDAAMFKDQGNKYRSLLRELLPTAEDAYREDDMPFRGHLGASLIGRSCARELWNSFHWVTKPSFEGRILRLFNRGHLEEPRLVALLQMIGCEVWFQDENGKQFRMKGHRGHFGGSLDAIIRGIPEMPDEPILGEFKTHNDKSFQKLLAEGVHKAKVEHYAQMQEYMGTYSLSWALYMACNKNDDALYCELVPFNQESYTRFAERAAMIIDAVEPPKRINNSPSWYQCKFCDHSPVCHGAKQPEVNCRTCKHSRVADDGFWECRNPEALEKAEAQGWQDPIDLMLKDQLEGCELYEVDPNIKAKV